MNGRVAPDQAGNLDAIAASMPGVTATPGGGISVLGLPPSQNSTMLNGLAFGGGSVPRGASTSTRVATSTYDPARGGISGALTQVTLSPGNQFTQRRGYLTLDAPLLQSADGIARRSGATYGAVDLNAGTEGNWYNDIFAQSDSLLLTRDQVDALRGAQASYIGRILAHWGTWAEELSTLPDHYDVADLVKRQNKLVDDAWEMARQEARTTLPKVLTPVQLELLPGNSAFIYRAEKPITNIRSFSTASCS